MSEEEENTFNCTKNFANVFLEDLYNANTKIFLCLFHLRKYEFVCQIYQCLITLLMQNSLHANTISLDHKSIDGTTLFKGILQPLDDLLPSTSQMSELKDISWTHPSTNETTIASKKLLGLISGTAALSKTPLQGDEEGDSFFSKERMSHINNLLAKEELPELGNYDQFELTVQTLVQIRLARVADQNFFYWSKIMLVVALFPQLIILTFITIQFILLKRREHKMRRNTQRITRERTLMQSLLAEMKFGRDHCSVV